MMILEQGDKILIAHRRLYESDGERYFIGTIEAYDHGIARASGRTWARSQRSGDFLSSDERTKIFSILSGTLIVYRLHRTTDLRALKFVVDDKRTWLKEGSRTVLDLTENY
jgi:hypothetical protein